MSLFGGGGSGQDAPQLSGIRISEMGYGTPIAILYGTTRLSPLLGYVADFAAAAHEEQSGGKNLGGGGSSTSYTYSTTLIYFACEGPVRQSYKIWRDKNQYDDITSAGFTYANLGTYPQDVWPYLTTAHPDHALAYNGMAYIAATGYGLGDSAALGNHSIEVAGRALSTNPSAQNYWDAHIKDVIDDFITNPHFGAVSSQTAALSIDYSAMHDYCAASGLLISPLVNSRKPAHEYLTEWITVANTAIVWSDATLKLKPYADEIVTGNGVTYTPDTTICAVFTDDNIAEAVKPKRKKPMDCYNKLAVDCLDRSNDYNKYSAEAKDQASIENYGLRPASNLSLECICQPTVALKVAYTQLQRQLYIRNEYTIKTWCDFDYLEPMDFVSVTDEALGMDAVRCRIKSMEDNQDGTITLTVEEAPTGVYDG